MDSESCNHLIIWLNTFEGIEGPHHSAEDLSDGVAMAEVLTQIAPDWFDTDWISKIMRDISADNHRLKLSNLKKVLKGMLDYYSEVLFQDANNFVLPDVTKIAEETDKSELGRMLQLVLLCAINCEEKQTYIEVIMALENDVQLSVMNSIQELIQGKCNSEPESPPSRDEIFDDQKSGLKSASYVLEKEQTAQRIHELEEQVRLLKEEKSTLMLENETLIKGGASNDSNGDSVSDSRTAALQQQLEKIKEENFGLETSKEDYKLRCIEKDKEVKDLTLRVEQLSSLAEEARSLKDEMDILRHTQDKVARYEATIESYKKKLAELGIMKQQMKTLEEKNEIYMQKTINLEEDSKKAGTLKAQVDMYKTQIHDIHNKLMETEKRCDKAEFDSQRAKDKNQSLEAENTRLKQERDMLKETNEELTLNQTSSENKAPDNIGKSLSVAQQFETETQDNTFELKEKVIRLEHQNKVLSLQLKEAENEKTNVLEGKLDIASERVSMLQTENRQLSQEVYELKTRLEESESMKTKYGDEEKAGAVGNNIQSKLQDHLDMLKESNSELQKKKEHIDDLESQTTANSSEISTLREQLNKKDEQMKEMEEKYKNYLQKAKTVIKTLDPKQTSGPDIQLNELRDRLQEKEKLIEHLERDHERMKVTKEREEKLIISAWYELSMQLHRRAADERHIGTAGLSFLSKQRQAASVRRSSLSPRGKVAT